MKIYKNLYVAVLASSMMVSCVDTTITDIVVEKPQSIAQYEYLNDYDVLKSYKASTINPDFKLGAGVTASNYIDGGLEYRVVTANFDEMTAGNAMKYASVVADDGSMNFSTVSNFVDKAKEAGLSIYGHTLAWHAQQNNKYLNSLIKDKELDIDPNEKIEVENAFISFSGYDKFPHYVMGYEPEIIDGILVSKYPDAWYQYFVISDFPTNPDHSYKVTAKIKGSKAGSLTVQMGNWSGALPTTIMEFTEDWSEASATINGITTETCFVVFQPGTFDGEIQIEWVKVSHFESPAVEVEQEVNFHTYTDGPFPYYAMGCEPPVINGSMHYEPNGAWNQFFILPGANNTLTEGDYVFYLDITADKDASSGVQLTIQNGWGSSDQNITVGVPIVAGQQEIKLKFPGVVGGAYDVILKPQTVDVTLDLKSVKVCKLEKMNTIPLTPEEKKDTLTWAMDKWIAGMMEATGGYVSAWDVVNEPISGADGDGDGWYDLQSVNNVNEEDAKNNFYWPDYLGNEDYVRIVVAKARQYYEEFGGTEPLKLFINDFNLESWWDGNKKLESLINWIKVWESDGITVIDGIGTQMHVSYILNEEDQAAQEASIVKMFELLKESNKLVKISELDMGIVDKAFGDALPTSAVTEEMHQKMADFYNFIISKYFEIIPTAQQYGITQWCLTDAPGALGTGWRGGQPVGLWNEGYNRKHTYAGFADGLAGK